MENGNLRLEENIVFISIDLTFSREEKNYQLRGSGSSPLACRPRPDECPCTEEKREKQDQTFPPMDHVRKPLS